MNKFAPRTIGLISDTHFHDRLWELPETLAEIFKGVDLILHAGDVGELVVLDLLGRIAPVVAVHGNDEPAFAKEQLPGEQLVAVASQRILLWHSHYPDPVEEKAKRGGPWGPKLDRMAAYGKALGAGIVVYGHSHVPMIVQHAGVLLINPGALAGGSYISRQVLATAGRLTVAADGGVAAQLYDLATGQPVDLPAPALEDEFSLLGSKYQTWIAEPSLVAAFPAVRQIHWDKVEDVVRAMQPLYRRSLTAGPMLRADLIEVIEAAPALTAHDRTEFLAALRSVD